MKYSLLFALSVALIFPLGCSEVRTIDAPPMATEETPEPQKTPAPPAAKETVEVEAKAGVTHRADWEDSSQEPMSIVTVPLATYFKAQEKAVFDMQIPQAMNLYWGEYGYYPRSEEDFMNDIIKKNQIILPKLREGDSYFYDVPNHKLMVRTHN